MVEIEILREDATFLVVNKPAGLLTQAPPTIDSLETRVREFLRRRDEHEGTPYLRLPHRLDRPVSGLLVMARHRRAARRLCEQFEGRLIQKMYWALVDGVVEPEHGQWIDYVRKIPDVAQAEIVDRRCDDARQAILNYRRLGVFAGQSLLEINLETGRYHQIRVQCASRRHAIVGDAQYGSTLPFGPICDDPRKAAIALYARQLVFRHPKTRDEISTLVEPPDYWQLETI